MYSPMDDAGFPVKAEEFVVLSQEPSVTETIAPKIARPFIEVRTKGSCLKSRGGSQPPWPDPVSGRLWAPWRFSPAGKPVGLRHCHCHCHGAGALPCSGLAATSSVFKTNCAGVEKQAVQVLKFKVESRAPAQGSRPRSGCVPSASGLSLCRVPGTDTSHFL